MTKKLLLYTKLANLYDEFYQKIFNYKKMAVEIDKILKRYKAKKILEVACGTGHLAKYLHDFGYIIIATDLFEEILNLARKNAPEIKFLKQDMKNLKLKQKFDAVICLGRSFTYMTTNEDVEKALNSFNKVLKRNGILIFDNFNAEKSIRNFDRYKRRTETIKLNDKVVVRKHKQSWNLSTGITWNWNCEYIIKQNNKVIQILKDSSVLRGFLKSELEYFLEKTGFKILEFYPKEFLIVAKEI